MKEAPNYLALYVFVIGFGLIALAAWIRWMSKYTRVVIYGYRRHSAPYHPELFPYPLHYKWPKGEPPEALYILLDPLTREWTVGTESIGKSAKVGFKAHVRTYLGKKNEIKHRLFLKNDSAASQLEYEIE